MHNNCSYFCYIEKPTCKDDFVSFKGRCLHFADTKVDQSTASQNCRIQQARLATIDRKYVRKGISSYLLKRKFDYYLIGLTNKWYGLENVIDVGENNRNKSYPLLLAKNNDIANDYTRSSVLGICRKSESKYFSF